MRRQDFSELLVRLQALTPQQKAIVLRRLDEERGHEGARVAGKLPEPIRCPHCDAPKNCFGSWGQSHGFKRYRCKSCGRTFNSLTGTALAHLRKREQWECFAQALIEGVSVRDAARRCQIDKNTAFLWRHRFLKYAAGHRATHEAGIVEADETFFLESFKGQRHLPRRPRHRGGVANKRSITAEQIPVLVVRDRSGQTADFQLSVLDAVHVCEKLEPLVDRDAILCTDSASVYAVFARTTGIAHRTINVRRGMRVVGGVFHIQNVNAYYSRLKSWMRRFHGVATQYLENYLGWRRLIERYAHTISPSACLAEAVGRPINS